ncbi:MAG: NADH-quinone oxidoreductase subunit I [Deltaproteobacteria bacterium]|nr:MAG: NADH-quinone oxidoreductase subunit I [Deltaproteobacteria bacterium]
MIRVKKVSRPKEIPLTEKLYLVEIAKGLAVTMNHFLKNLTNPRSIPTIDYPEVKRPVPPRFRGRHRLTKRPDGTPKCVACYCCATACPAVCITIEAGEHPDPQIEKYPVRFDIDMLRCIYCGMCVDACPEDAIRMDTGWYTVPERNREDLVYTIDMLLSD